MPPPDPTAAGAGPTTPPLANASPLIILGGGPAGLAVGYYARKANLPFTIFEAADRVGGNAVTWQHDDFRFDSGAHRFHNAHGEATAEIRALLGADLRLVRAPSQIYHHGRYIDFPLALLPLLRGLGRRAFARAAFDVLRARLKGGPPPANFEDFALRTYGRTLAKAFLLGYSERVWGAPCHRLSTEIAGKRMKGLHLRAFLSEAVLRRNGSAEHLEGMSFYYPRDGIGAIADRLAAACGRDHIVTGARVTRVLHRDGRVRAVEINGRERITPNRVVSTLPLDDLVEMLDPAPPADVLAAAAGVEFRDMVLVAHFLARPSVTRAATVYFPDAGSPFTRVCEPRNRSPLMSPAGQTSLVAEIPCRAGGPLWRRSDEEWIDTVRAAFLRLGWFAAGDVLGAEVRRLTHAYPVLDIESESRAGLLKAYLGGLHNLRLSGRNGLFVYAWIHDMMIYGRDIIAELVEG